MKKVTFLCQLKGRWRCPSKHLSSPFQHFYKSRKKKEWEKGLRWMISFFCVLFHSFRLFVPLVADFPFWTWVHDDDDCDMYFTNTFSLENDYKNYTFKTSLFSPFRFDFYADAVLISRYSNSTSTFPFKVPLAGIRHTTQKRMKDTYHHFFKTFIVPPLSTSDKFIKWSFESSDYYRQ